MQDWLEFPWPTLGLCGVGGDLNVEAGVVFLAYRVHVPGPVPDEGVGASLPGGGDCPECPAPGVGHFHVNAVFGGGEGVCEQLCFRLLLVVDGDILARLSVAKDVEVCLGIQVVVHLVPQLQASTSSHSGDGEFLRVSLDASCPADGGSVGVLAAAALNQNSK